MKKMITDKIWEDEWFSELEPQHKLLWFYIITKTDSRACWEPNLKVASFHCGYNYDKKEIEEKFKGKYVLVKNLWFIPNYIKYHYGKKLSKNSNYHKAVVNFIEENNLFEVVKEYGIIIENIETQEKSGEVSSIVKKYWGRLPSTYEIQEFEKLKEDDKKYLIEALKQSSVYNKKSVKYVLAIIENMRKQEAIELAKIREREVMAEKERERAEIENPEFQKIWKETIAKLREEINTYNNNNNNIRSNNNGTTEKIHNQEQ